jgi:arylsulfatase A-like enzyme
VSRLKELGLYDNTVIMYLQDNGACAEGIGKNDENPPGGPDSYIAYNLPWAHLGNTPFTMYKHFVHEGGISTPFIFHWPAGLAESQKGTIERESFGHLIDIVPTCMDLAGIEGQSFDYPLEGQSLLGVVKGSEDNSTRKVCWEHEGNRAIRKGDWKLISRYENDYRYFEQWEFPKKPRQQEWELYNVKKDRWELNECAQEYPEIVDELKKEYEEYYQRIGAVPRMEIIEGSKFDF